MTVKEQCKFMIETHGSSENAIVEHQKIMTNIENIYPSKEECIKNSLSYNHLVCVMNELTLNKENNKNLK